MQYLCFFSFFQIFTSVVVFGLFHGLVFLPVILSIVGPEPYDTKFLSPIEDQPETKYAELAANQELSVHENNHNPEHIRLCEVPPKLGNGNVKHSYISGFPTENGTVCNSFEIDDILDFDPNLDKNAEDNPRVSFLTSV